MPGFYDIHSHILPGVDDGAHDMKETRKLLRAEYREGVRTVFVTPHYRTEFFDFSYEQIKMIYEQVKEDATYIGEDLQILLGCEYHADMDMIDTLSNKECPTMAGTRCVLVEFSENADKKFIMERCYDLLSNGYQPIIAHAERYNALNKGLDFMEQLVDVGVYIQLNAGSIIGEGGFTTKRFCRKVMKNDMLHFVGSDAHNMTNRKPMIRKCAEYIEKVMGKEYMIKILEENPRNLILNSK